MHAASSREDSTATQERSFLARGKDRLGGGWRLGRFTATAALVAGMGGAFGGLALDAAAPATAGAAVVSPTCTSGFPADGNVVAIVSTPSGNGYWEVDQLGDVVTFGNATCEGSLRGALAAPIVGMAATPSGNGYWLVASDGGVFALGDAHFDGSMGGSHLNAPIVGMPPRRREAATGSWRPTEGSLPSGMPASTAQPDRYPSAGPSSGWRALRPAAATGLSAPAEGASHSEMRTTTPEHRANTLREPSPLVPSGDDGSR